MLLSSAVGSSSISYSPPSPIKAVGGSNQSIGGSSSLMHASFGVPRRHSDDVVSTSLSTTTYRPRRSISSSGGQQQTHVLCMMNNYSHSLPSTRQQNTSDDEQQTRSTQSVPNNLNLTQELFNDDDEDEDISNELNLAVVVGNEDTQSLHGFSAEQTNQENGSLNVAFIDETDLERQKILVENEKCDQTDAMDIPNSNNNETLSQTVVANCEQQSIEMYDLCQKNELDEILRQNENRSIRLTDSDVNSKPKHRNKIFSIIIFRTKNMLILV